MNSSCETKGARPFEFPEIASVTVKQTVEGQLWASATETSTVPSVDLARAHDMAEQARREGCAEGEARARTTFEEQMQEQRQQVERCVAGFAEERASYFRRVETEVVSLALAIARKILHREAQVDPMLLASLVRAALSELDLTSTVTLHVRPDAVGAWRAFFEQCGRRGVQIAGDSSVAPFHCFIQAEVGTTEISVDSQLKEIEVGFFDLLASRGRTEQNGTVQ